MSERAKGCTVAFAGGLRDGDIDGILIAIGQLRRVVSIAPILEKPEDWIADQRAKHELTNKIHSIIKPDAS